LALLDHSIYPQQFLPLQRRQRVKELVRRSFFHQSLNAGFARNPMVMKMASYFPK